MEKCELKDKIIEVMFSLSWSRLLAVCNTLTSVSLDFVIKSTAGDRTSAHVSVGFCPTSLTHESSTRLHSLLSNLRNAKLSDGTLRVDSLVASALHS